MGWHVQDVARPKRIVRATVSVERDRGKIHLVDPLAGNAGTIQVFASRTSPALSSLQSRVFNWIVSLATGSHFSDIASRTRATRPELLRELNLYGDFNRHLPLLAQRAGFSVQEIQTAQHPQAFSKALHSPLSYLWRLMDVLSVMFINRFTRYPLRRFGASKVCSPQSAGSCWPRSDFSGSSSTCPPLTAHFAFWARSCSAWAFRVSPSVYSENSCSSSTREASATTGSKQSTSPPPHPS